MSEIAAVSFAGVGIERSAAYMLPVTWLEVAKVPVECRLLLKPVSAPCAMGLTPTSPVIAELGTVLTPALERMAKLPAVPSLTDKLRGYLSAAMTGAACAAPKMTLMMAITRSNADEVGEEE